MLTFVTCIQFGAAAQGGAGGTEASGYYATAATRSPPPVQIVRVCCATSTLSGFAIRMIST